MVKPDIEPVQHSLYPTYNSLSHCFQHLCGELPINQPNQLKAALLSYQNTLLQQLDKKSTSLVSVDDLAKARYPNQTYDTGLPQEWVNKMSDRGMDPRGHFITLYPSGSAAFGYMAPITPEGVEMAARIATTEV